MALLKVNITLAKEPIVFAALGWHLGLNRDATPEEIEEAIRAWIKEHIKGKRRFDALQASEAAANDGL